MADYDAGVPGDRDLLAGIVALAAQGNGLDVEARSPAFELNPESWTPTFGFFHWRSTQHNSSWKWSSDISLDGSDSREMRRLAAALRDESIPAEQREQNRLKILEIADSIDDEFSTDYGDDD